MLAFAQLWRLLTDTWSTPRRARLVYVAMAVGFAAMAIAGEVADDALVVTLGAVFAAVTLALATLVPRLSGWARNTENEGQP
jgi:hypothetical protein